MVDELKTMEQLEAELAQYKAIVDFSLEGIYIAQDRKLKFCNRRFADMFGFADPGDAVGTDVMKLVSPKSRELVERELEAREKGRKQVSQYVFFARRLDGSELEVETLAGRIIYNGSPAVQGVMRDITRERQLESRLQQAQKMEAIGTLAGGIAHDFNNILSVIIGYTELSLDSRSQKIRTEHNLEQILKAAMRARDLVQQILSFSRQSEKEKKPVKINLIVNEVLNLIRASLPSTIKIVKNISKVPYVVLADPTQMHQVLMNLCTNAAHAMKGKGGVLKVELSDLNRDLAAASEDVSAPSPYLRLTVSDSGHGMAQEIKDRIFDPFYTTKAPGEGTGMGLSVVHGIVKNLDGEISVESESGKGTSFHLFLPLLEEAPAIKKEQKKEIPRGNERIMLVDDEVVLARVGEKILKQLGYKVTAETSSIDALETFRADPDSFDLVISDLTMPDLTGIELAKKMIAIKADVRVIICTGFSHQVSRDNIRDLGIKELIVKPYNKKEFAVTIRKVLEN
jgi:PAS domain S-box-containing protein